MNPTAFGKPCSGLWLGPNSPARGPRCSQIPAPVQPHRFSRGWSHSPRIPHGPARPVPAQHGSWHREVAAGQRTILPFRGRMNPSNAVERPLRPSTAGCRQPRSHVPNFHRLLALRGTAPHAEGLLSSRPRRFPHLPHHHGGFHQRLEPRWHGRHRQGEKEYGGFLITRRAQTSPVGAATVLGVPPSPQVWLRPPVLPRLCCWMGGSQHSLSWGAHRDGLWVSGTPHHMGGTQRARPRGTHRPVSPNTHSKAKPGLNSQHSRHPGPLPAGGPQTGGPGTPRNPLQHRHLKSGIPEDPLQDELRRLGTAGDPQLHGGPPIAPGATDSPRPRCGSTLKAPRRCSIPGQGVNR